ncbi:hypothetical protein X777_12736, partial [Ooceraea biroi]
IFGTVEACALWLGQDTASTAGWGCTHWPGFQRGDIFGGVATEGVSIGRRWRPWVPTTERSYRGKVHGNSVTVHKASPRALHSPPACSPRFRRQPTYRDTVRTIAANGIVLAARTASVCAVTD